MEQRLDILFENEHLVAVNKPHGLLVHRSSMATDAKEFAMQILRNQLGMHVYPAHRLDRKTGGALLFAKSEEDNSALQEKFREGEMHKVYHAVVRGFIPEKGIIDYPLHNGKTAQEAVTHYQALKHFEIPLAHGKFPTSRYSLVELKPTTGRFHQLRKHMAHLRHPIIGDRPHGCNKQNKLWKEKFEMTTMLLHASKLSFSYKDEDIRIEAPLQEEFQRVRTILNTAD